VEYYRTYFFLVSDENLVCLQKFAWVPVTTRAHRMTNRKNISAGRRIDLRSNVHIKAFVSDGSGHGEKEFSMNANRGGVKVGVDEGGGFANKKVAGSTTQLLAKAAGGGVAE
jgi:hypothetical protein